MHQRTVLPTLILAALGCKSENAVYERHGHDTWHQVPTDQVDILFVVDDSGSMEQEQTALAAGFASFVQELETTGNDFHLGVIKTTFEPGDPNRGALLGSPPVITKDTDYVGLFQQRVVVGTAGADFERGLQAAEYALSPSMSLGKNAGFLRADAFLTIVWVSDENDCSDDFALEGQDATACYNQQESLVPVAEYVAELRDLKEDPSRVITGVIVGPDNEAGCLDAYPGRRYWELAEATGGVIADICETDWSQLLHQMGLEAAGIRTSFQLSDGAKPETLEVFVDDVPVLEDPVDGWTYDADTHYITFHGLGVPPRDATIDATYTLASG